MLDTSYLAALHQLGDVHHKQAAALAPRLDAGEWGERILLEYVYVELMNLLAKRRGGVTACRVGDYLLSADLRLVGCSAGFEDTVDAFRRVQPTHLGFVDVAITAYARAHARGQVATFDRELAAQPGIVPLPTPDGGGD